MVKLKSFLSLNYLYSYVFNILLSSIFFYLWYMGIVDEAIKHNTLYINQAISVVFIIGIICSYIKSDFKYWCISSLTGLGLMGTIYGIWIAFSAIDPSNVGSIDTIGTTVSQLILGVGVAIWTTLVGLFFSIWLYGVSLILGDDDETL